MNDLVISPAEQAIEKDLQLVNSGIELFQSVPAILRGNRNSVMNAEHAVKKFMAKVEANGGTLNEELDKEAEQLIVKVKATGNKMMETRSPNTQIFTAIQKMFTSLEATVKALADSIQPLRNDWAKFLIAETERKQKEAAAKAAIETAKAELSGWIIGKIGMLLNAILFKKKEGWTASFNMINLENFSVKEAGLRGLKTTISQVEIDSQLVIDLPYSSLPADIKEQVMVDTCASYNFSAWIEQSAIELTEYKQHLIDRLASKKSELEEAAEAERKRLAEIESQRLEAIKRQQEIDKAAGEKKKQLEEQQRLQKIEDDKRNAELELERKRLDDERALREKEDAERLEKEKEEANRKSQESAAMATTAATAQTLFDAAIEATPDTVAPESRQGYEITVLNHAGFAQLFQFWYSNKAIAMNMDDCLKTTIKQMKSFAEGEAKDGKFIESKFLRYEKTAKAVNRKAA